MDHAEGDRRIKVGEKEVVVKKRMATILERNSNSSRSNSNRSTVDTMSVSI